MKWLIITCNKTKHILPAYMHQFNKYVPTDIFEPIVIDLEDMPVGEWTRNVLSKIDNIIELHEKAIFSLDDYLITDKFNLEYFNHISRIVKFNRFELGFTATRAGVQTKLGYNMYRYTDSYRASCQISAWDVGSLYGSLLDGKGKSPWMWENEGKVDGIVIGGKVTTLKYIEHSALSQKWEGINLDGMKEDDVDDLVSLGLIKKEDIRK